MIVCWRILRQLDWRNIMKSIATLIAAASLLAALANAQTPRYTVTDLGTFGGNFSVAFGINNAGRVGGTAALPNGNAYAFLTGIAKTDLGTLGGPNSQAGGPNGADQLAILRSEEHTSELQSPM